MMPVCVRGWARQRVSVPSRDRPGTRWPAYSSAICAKSRVRKDDLDGVLGLFVDQTIGFASGLEGEAVADQRLQLQVVEKLAGEGETPLARPARLKQCVNGRDLR